MIAYYKRVAVRDGPDHTWRWFRPPIPFRLIVRWTDDGPRIEDDDEAFRTLEDQLAEAVFYRPTSWITVVESRMLDDLNESSLRFIM